MSPHEVFGWLLAIATVLVIGAYLEHLLLGVLAFVLLGPVALPVAYEASAVPLAHPEPVIVLSEPLERQGPGRVEYWASYQAAREERPQTAPVPAAAMLMGSALGAMLVIRRRATP